MRIFKNPSDNSNHGYYVDGSQDDLITAAIEAGWQELTDEEITATLPADSGGPPIEITKVTMRQARLALLAAGKLSAVATAIAALPEPQRTEAQINWDYASHVEKDSPLIQTLAPAIDLDAAAVTELFNHAATL